MTRIRVVHRAGYDYDPWAMASHNQARMTPKTTPGQFVLSHKVEITPTAWQHAYTDYWGNQVLAFEVHEKHNRLLLVSTSEVDVLRGDVLRSEGDGVHESLSWADLASPSLQDGLCEFLDPTPDTDVSAVLHDEVAALRERSATPIEFVAGVQQLVSGRVHIEPRPFGVHQHAVDAWNQGAGLGRDLAHLMVGALRMADIPTRYVSGYCLPRGEAEVGVPVRGESHPWLEFWDGRWVGIDPIDGSAPDDTYVEVAHGRDFHDVNPLSGIFTGVRTADTFVEIRLTRLG